MLDVSAELLRPPSYIFLYPSIGVGVHVHEPLQVTLDEIFRQAKKKKALPEFWPYIAQILPELDTLPVFAFFCLFFLFGGGGKLHTPMDVWCNSCTALNTVTVERVNLQKSVVCRQSGFRALFASISARKRIIDDFIFWDLYLRGFHDGISQLSSVFTLLINVAAETTTRHVIFATVPRQKFCCLIGWEES